MHCMPMHPPPRAAPDRELVKGTLPLLVLQLVSEADTYGYELIRALEERSAAAFTFSEGTLYPVLHSLERDGLVTSRWDTSGGGRRRKYYRISPAGRADLADRLDQWHAFTRAVEAIVDGEPRGRA